MAEQTFEVSYTKRVRFDIAEVDGWDQMSAEDRNDYIGNIAFERLQSEGPDTEDVYGVTE